MRRQIDLVSYRPRPLKAFILLAIGFAFGGYVIPDYLIARHQYYARINCIQHHPLPAPMGRLQ
jgi:hypothetical protein